jgi:hypothetical protein
MATSGIENVLNSAADRSGIATVGWAVAGIPLVATFAQAMFALVGIVPSARSEAFANLVGAVGVLYEAALLFKSRSTIVIGLFTLIGIAWLVQGSGMFVLRDKGITLLAAGLGGVLYFALFFGVYLPLLNRGLPALELIGFFVIPFVATGAVLGSAVLFPWGVELEEETKTKLRSIESDLKEKQRALETKPRDFIENFDAREFERVAPRAVANAKDEYRAARETYDDLADDLDALRESNDTPTERRAKASEIEKEVDELDPVARAAEIEDEFRSTLARALRDEYDDPPEGYSNDVTNMSRRYVELSIPHVGEEIRIESLGSELGNAVRGTDGDPVSLDGLRNALQSVETDIDSLRNKLETEIQAVETRLADAEDEYTAAKEQLEEFPPRVAKKVREIVVENRGSDFIGYKQGHTDESIQTYKRTARTQLEECQFDEARQAAEKAADAADDLSTFVEYVGHVVRGVDVGKDRIRIPSQIEATSDLEAVCAQIGADAGVTLTVGDGHIIVSTDSPPDPDTETGDTLASGDVDGPTGGDSGEGSDGSRNRSRRDIVDPVCMIYRETKRRSEDSEGHTVGCVVDDLPAMARADDVLTHAVEFATEQSELVADADLNTSGDKRHVEFTVAADRDPELALQDLATQYRDRYG